MQLHYDGGILLHFPLSFFKFILPLAQDREYIFKSKDSNNHVHSVASAQCPLCVCVCVCLSQPSVSLNNYCSYRTFLCCLKLDPHRATHVPQTQCSHGETFRNPRTFSFTCCMCAANSLCDLYVFNPRCAPWSSQSCCDSDRHTGRQVVTSTMQSDYSAIPQGGMLTGRKEKQSMALKQQDTSEPS